MTKQELINYFVENHNYGLMSKDQFIKMLEEKTTEELQELHAIDIKRKQNENEVFENGTLAYMIDFKYDLRKNIEKYMWDQGMFTIYNGRANYGCSSDGRLYYVPIQFVNELSKHFEITTVNEMYILGRKDISNFSEGDKVKITTNGILGYSDRQGTVVNVEDDQILVRKYRSKKQGYALKIGQECFIEKISKFNKNIA